VLPARVFDRSTYRLVQMSGDGSAAVIGAGIGGLAAAIALGRAGREVIVYEAAPEHRPLGAGISIWPNGVRALRSLGLERLLDRGLTQAGGVRRADGSMLAGFGPEAIQRRFGEPILGLHRAELHEALLAGCGAERVRLGMRLSAIEGEELRFEDGTTARAELIVGADGLNSAVRAELLGDGAPDDAGIVAYRGVAAGVGEVPAGEWWGIGSVAGLLPLRDGRVYWYFGARGEDRPGRLAELAGAYDARVAEVVAGTPAEQVLVHRLYDRDPVSGWSRGGATLLGDAAHPMLPFIGQGAGAALEDAVVLGACVGAHDDVATALAAYERARAERTALFVKKSRQGAAVALPASVLARRLRDTLLPLLPESARLRQFAPLLDWSP
jgi:2-polyprenyl-6-methoxyphenol hydroxylase-like FAD-dependent oxidoreductase